MPSTPCRGGEDPLFRERTGAYGDRVESTQHLGIESRGCTSSNALLPDNNEETEGSSSTLHSKVSLILSQHFAQPEQSYIGSKRHQSRLENKNEQPLELVSY